MANEIRDQLKQAQSLIKQRDKQGAINIIKPILRENKELASAWWLLANALDDPKQQRHALQQVLRIRPGEPRAKKMLEILSEVKKDAFGFDDPFAVFDALDDTPYPAPVENAPSKQPSDPFAMFDQFDVDENDDYSEFDNDDDDPFSDIESIPIERANPPSQQKKRRSNRPLGIAIVLALIIIVGAGVVVFVMNQNDSSRPSSTGFCEDNGNAIVNCAQMQIGQLWEGELTANQEHYWTFQAQANQRVRIDAEGLDSNTDTVLRLYAPDGILLMSNDDINFPENVNSRIDMILTNAGEYRLVVTTFAGTTGRYSIYLQDRPNTATTSDSTICPAVQVTCGQIALGAEVNGELNGETAHSWTFNGDEGQRVTITVTGLNNIDTTVRLYNEADTPLDFNDDIDFEGGNLNSEIAGYVLPTTGTYRIEVDTFGLGGGQYSLRLSTN